jgi:carbon-monoxide dehydrogenase large subunit
MPTADAFPHIDAITLEDAPSRLNPLGAKGAGEGGLVATGAAVANAVAAALGPMGAAVLELPLSADRVFALLARGAATPLAADGSSHPRT